MFLHTFVLGRTKLFTIQSSAFCSELFSLRWPVLLGVSQCQCVPDVFWSKTGLWDSLSQSEPALLVAVCTAHCCTNVHKMELCTVRQAGITTCHLCKQKTTFKYLPYQKLRLIPPSKRKWHSSSSRMGQICLLFILSPLVFLSLSISYYRITVHGRPDLKSLGPLGPGHRPPHPSDPR